MENGVPSSFLDLILSALAAVIILTIIQPQQPFREDLIIYVHFKPQENQRLEVTPFIELEMEGEKYYSKQVIFDPFIDIQAESNNAVIRIRRDQKPSSLRLTISIFDDAIAMIKGERIAVSIFSNYYNIYGNSILSAENSFFFEKAIDYDL